MSFTPSNFPRDWYWVASDGRVFASARCAIVTAADADFLAFKADGFSPSAWPADDTEEQTTASLQAVLAPFGLAADLAVLKTTLSAAIDAEAEQQRLRYITAGSGQAMVYLQKQTQAAIALNAQPATAAATADANAAAYPLLAAEIGITVDPTTNAPATDVLGVARQVNATVQQWMPIAAAIERARMATKAAIGAATTAEAAQAARDAVQWPAPA